MKNLLINGESQGIWTHGHAQEWRPAISRVVHWVKKRHYRRSRRCYTFVG